MGDQALVVPGDLGAQILLLRFKEDLGISPFQSGDEKTQEATEEIADAFERRGAFVGVNLA
jgi:hypothetical protein